MKNSRIFYLENCHFFVVKFSVYLNRRVFVMSDKDSAQDTHPRSLIIYYSPLVETLYILLSLKH